MSTTTPQINAVDALTAIADAATPGPWRSWDNGEVEALPRYPDLSASDPLGEMWTERDARFIATFDPPTVSKLLAVVQAAEDHCHHVNEEWDRVAAMRPQDPELWERWENERERLIEVTRAALAALHDTEEGA